MVHLHAAQTAAIGLPLQLVGAQPQTPLNPSSKYCAQSRFLYVMSSLSSCSPWPEAGHLTNIPSSNPSFFIFHVESLFLLFYSHHFFASAIPFSINSYKFTILVLVNKYFCSIANYNFLSMSINTYRFNPCKISLYTILGTFCFHFALPTIF